MYPKLIIGSQGVFTLAAPFDKELVSRPDSVKIQYKVAALNSIESLEMSGLDVFNTIYKPKGLDEVKFSSDKLNDVTIVTLTSIGLKTVYVPQSYITTTPVYDGVKYFEPIIHASLGLIPLELDLTYLQQQISAVITDVVGVTEDKILVKVSALPVNGVVGLDDHEEMETIRKNNIKTRPTDRANALRLENENTELKKEIAYLQQLCLDNGLIVPSTK